MTFWKRQNYGDSTKISSCLGLRGWKGTNRQNTGDLQGSENTLHDTVMINKCHHTFVQSHRMHNTKSTPRYKPWTLGDFDVPMQVVISFNKCTTLMEDVENGGGQAYVGVGSIWEISQFGCEPKTAL